jgi:release factor glutamine methyltransferase
VRLLVLPGVLRPPSDCWLLAQTMQTRNLARRASVLDVFTGSGALAVAAALQGAERVTAVDVSRRAVLNARLNARLNGVRMRSLRGDLFAPVRGQRYELILANPPYLPSLDGELPGEGAARAWEGGTDGRLLVNRLCEEAATHLTERGSVLIVHSSLTGEEATLRALGDSGLDAEVVARQRGPLGPIASARVELLEGRGLLEAGVREEEILVIHGRR